MEVKVKDLIEKLQKLEQDTEILIEGDEFGRIAKYKDIDKQDFYSIEGKTWEY